MIYKDRKLYNDRKMKLDLHLSAQNLTPKDQRSQHKTLYLALIKENLGNVFELTGKGKYFLNTNSIS